MKPVVTYGDAASTGVGGSAILWDVQGHPRLGDVPTIYTSQILREEVDGEIETLNTIYRRRVETT